MRWRIVLGYLLLVAINVAIGELSVVLTRLVSPLWPEQYRDPWAVWVWFCQVGTCCILDLALQRTAWFQQRFGGRSK